MEITDHGFDVSLTIYLVFQMKNDCNDELQLTFIRREDAVKWIEENTTENQKFYFLKTYAWFNE